MIILSIETSCDETAAAVTRSDPTGSTLLSDIVSSQVKLHAAWGGVVPNLAAREHLKNIMPVIKEALAGANVTQKDIDLIAVTNGPGLIPALLVGVGAAKTLSYLWNVPLLGIHHIEGHIYANFVREVKIHPPAGEAGKSKIKSDEVKFPILCLVVSGGHTQLVLMKKHLDYDIVGQTLDDAAGEAFDKVARILELGYPGGPAISARAEKFKITENPKYQLLDTELPRPMANSKDFNFSFSGLKTAVLYKYRALQKDLPDDKKEILITELAAEFQKATTDVLVAKTIAAAKKYGTRTIMLAGGVSANTKLRQTLAEKVTKELEGVDCILPDVKYSGDNAAMIGTAAHFHIQMTKEKKIWKDNWKKLEALADLKLKNL